MVKKLLTAFFCIAFIYLHASIVIPDYKFDIPLDKLDKGESGDQSIDPSKRKNDTKSPNIFSFKLGNIPGDLTIVGNWKVRLGYGSGFVLFPELMWLTNVAGMKEGVIFEQERLFSLDWITENGINLHLFFNDNLEESEFTFKYWLGKIFNSFYITNKFNELDVNPYRSLKGGKVSDINVGFDWGTKFYKPGKFYGGGKFYEGRFDIQFDSSKKVSDSFKGNNKFIKNKIFSSNYLRGVYYYLPDKNITGEITLYLSDDNGEVLQGLPSNFKEGSKYKRLYEGKDFKIDGVDGLVVFKESIFGKTLLINYNTNINGKVYQVGDINSGLNGVYGMRDFNKVSDGEYFVDIGDKTFLILSSKNSYSYFEEKNSYKIAQNESVVSNLNLEIFDNNNIKLSGFGYIYDEYTGSIRITKNSEKKSINFIYPFFDYVTDKGFYLNNTTPKDRDAKNIISYDALVSGESLKLSQKPVNGSITVFVNSTQIESKYYTYDYASQSISVSFDVKDSDTITVYYIADENDSYNLSASLKNSFKIGKYLMLSDSLWYKMPIKLWEDSFYNKLHSAELIYNGGLKGDFRKMLLDTKNGKLEFNTNFTLSLFVPELKSITIIEDFEVEKRGYSISLEYKDYFPVTIPKLIYPELATSRYGKLFFRNTHNLGITTNSNYISIYNNLPEREPYSSSGTIGPYSSSDGYYGEKNSLSLVTEFELKSNEAVSLSIPLDNKEYDWSAFNQLVTAIKSDSLDGEVRVYFDAGLVSERFNDLDTIPQKESLDEGIKYLTEDNFYVYKGRNDGQNQTNDFDNNGILDEDDISEITTFKYFRSFDNSTDYITIKNGESKIANFRINDPDKLKNIRAFRITIYSQSGATGKLIINQLRLTESGFTQDKGKNSFADEIFPAEDETLINNIFSQKNSDFDKRLHFQRDKERTLRIRLKNSEDFSIYKKFLTPIDISLFKKIGFFIFLKNKSSKTLKFTLVDSRGVEISKKIELANYEEGRWHNITTLMKEFANYSYSTRAINQIRFDFLNENGIDIFDNDIFLDEIYMEESEVFAGFANKNEFIYEDPKVNFKTKDGVTIFGLPKFRVATLFATDNFLKDEMLLHKNHSLNIDSLLSFKFITADFLFLTNLDIFFGQKVYSPNETMTISVVRNVDKFLPLIFSAVYNYKRDAIVDNGGVIRPNTKKEDRKLLLNIGFKLKPLYFRVDYDIDSQKNDLFSNNNKFVVDFKLNFEKINFAILYNIYNKRERKKLLGEHWFDNLGYIFSEDFLSFFYDGDNKSQYLNLISNFEITPNIALTNTLSYRDLDIKGISNFVILTRFENKTAIGIKIDYKRKKNSFFTTEYSRLVENSHNKDYHSIYWEDYFYNFSLNLGYLTPVIFYPPFSGLYKVNDREIFGNSYRFGRLNDNLKLEFNWGQFLSKTFFLPYKFRFSFTESILNSIFYTSDYTIQFGLLGEGEVTTLYLKNLNASYSVNQTINLKPLEKTFKTEVSFSLNLYLFNNIDIENHIAYFINYSHGSIKKEFNHNINLKTKFFKDFYKKDYVIGDKNGVDLTVTVEYTANFYHRLDMLSDMLNNPANIYLIPQVGYRFNKNFKVNGVTKLGYSLEHSPILNQYKNNFAFEFWVEGVLTF